MARQVLFCFLGATWFGLAWALVKLTSQAKPRRALPHLENINLQFHSGGFCFVLGVAWLGLARFGLVMFSLAALFRVFPGVARFLSWILDAAPL